MTGYQDYVDQPRTLEAALECIRRLTVERNELRRELRDEATTALETITERDRARRWAVTLEQQLAATVELVMFRAREHRMFARESEDTNPPWTVRIFRGEADAVERLAVEILRFTDGCTEAETWARLGWEDE